MKHSSTPDWDYVNQNYSAYAPVHRSRSRRDFLAGMAHAFTAADEMHVELLAQVEALVNVDPPKYTRDGVRLRRLARIVAAYEKLRWPIGKAAKKFRSVTKEKK